MPSEAELRALVEKWTDRADTARRDSCLSEAQALEACADDLESLLASQEAEPVNIKAAIARLWSAYPAAGYARSQLRVVFQLLGEEPPDPDEPEATQGDVGSPAHVALWDAINTYAETCGGDPPRHVYGNTPRQRAVVEVENALRVLASQGTDHPHIGSRIDVEHMAETGHLRTADGSCDQCELEQAVVRLPVPHRSSDADLQHIAGSLTTYTEPFRSMAAELLNFRRCGVAQSDDPEQAAQERLGRWTRALIAALDAAERSGS